VARRHDVFSRVTVSSAKATRNRKSRSSERYLCDGVSGNRHTSLIGLAAKHVACRSARSAPLEQD
jgi:hypothetical protein